MASNEQILEALLSKTSAISMSDLAKELGVKAAEISTPLKRLCEEKPGKPALISVNEEGNYELTDAGRQKINPNTEVSEGLTEGEIFKNYGIRIGVKKDIVSLVQEHVWNGGDPKDLNWVKKALAEMNIASDLAGRWISVWRTYLLRGITSDDTNAAAERGVITENPPRPTNSKEDGGGTVHLRDYIIDSGNNPIYVGEGIGNLDYGDAVKLATLRAAAKAQIPFNENGGGSGGESQIDQTSKMYDLIKKISAGDGPKKTTLIIPDGKGGVTIQEAEAGSNIMIPKIPEGTGDNNSNNGNRGGKGYYLDPETNEMKEIDPNKPIVIVRKEVINTGGEKMLPRPKIFVVDNGVLREQDADKPIIIEKNPPPTQTNPGAMFTIPTAGGGSAAVSLDDLNKWMDVTFKVEDHKRKVARDEENHESLMDVVKTFKDFGTKAVRAASNMAPDTGEEGEGGA